MTNAEAAKVAITFGADAKSPILARIMAKMAQTLLKNPSDEYNQNDDTSFKKVSTDVMDDMIDEAVEEMTQKGIFTTFKI